MDHLVDIHRRIQYGEHAAKRYAEAIEKAIDRLIAGETEEITITQDGSIKEKK